MRLSAQLRCFSEPIVLAARLSVACVRGARVLGRVQHEDQRGRTFDGPFSAVSTPPIARVGAFFSISRDLQDKHFFASLKTQNFTKFRLSFAAYFAIHRF